MSEPGDLPEIAGDVGRYTGYDRTLDAAIDGLALIPFAGPIVAGALRQMAPRDRDLYLAQFALEVAHRIEAIDAEKVDRDYLQSDAFQDDFDQVGRAILERKHRQKRQHFMAALVNGATVERPEEVEQHRFLDLLETLRPSHLRLLAAVLRADDLDPGGNIDGWLTQMLPNQDLENAKLDWGDLQRADVLQDLPTGLATTSIGERVRHSVNAFGKRYATFIELEADALERAE